MTRYFSTGHAIASTTRPQPQSRTRSRSTSPTIHDDLPLSVPSAPRLVQQPFEGSEPLSSFLEYTSIPTFESSSFVHSSPRATVGLGLGLGLEVEDVTYDHNEVDLERETELDTLPPAPIIPQGSFDNPIPIEADDDDTPSSLFTNPSDDALTSFSSSVSSLPSNLIISPRTPIHVYEASNNSTGLESGLGLGFEGLMKKDGSGAVNGLGVLSLSTSSFDDEEEEGSPSRVLLEEVFKTFSEGGQRESEGVAEEEGEEDVFGMRSVGRRGETA